MKIIKINQIENTETMAYDFRIVLFGVKFRRTLYHQQVIIDNLPLWYRASKWLLQKTCKHQYEKKGKPKRVSYFFGDEPEIMTQNVKCKFCSKEGYYQYEWGIDTSF